MGGGNVPGVQLASNWLFAPASPAHRATHLLPLALCTYPKFPHCSLACPAHRTGLGKDEGCAPQETAPLVEWQEWVKSAFCAIWPALLSGQGNSSHDLLRTAFTTYRTYFTTEYTVSNVTPARLFPTLWWTRHDIVLTPPFPPRPGWMCIISNHFWCTMHMHRLANDPEKAAGRTCENRAQLQRKHSVPRFPFCWQQKSCA